MKKLFLLMAAGVLVGSANGQVAQRSVVFTRNEQATANTNRRAGNATLPSSVKLPKSVTDRTTSTSGRWYNYVDTVFGTNTSVASYGFSLLPIWNDTTAELGYTDSGTPTYYNNDWTSLGLGFVPFIGAWNNPLTAAGDMYVSNMDNYTIDSVIVVAVYGRSFASPAKIAVKDSLRFGFVSGDGTGTSNLPYYYFTGTTATYGVDTLNYLQMFHDSLNNTAAPTSTSTPPITYFSFPLVSTDTSVANDFVKVFPVNFPVSAGNAAAVAVSFKSMDASYPTTGAVPRDTIQRADNSFKYGVFEPLVAFNGDATAIEYAPFSASDPTSGYFKREGSLDDGWGGSYIPNWAFSTATGASGLQYPYIIFHVSCSTCGVVNSSLGVQSVSKINSVTAYPNPATSALNISYTLAQNSSVSVTLTNMLGQVVATQNTANVSNGNAVFNTSTLPDGMYIYTLQSNGKRSTGHVMIAH